MSARLVKSAGTAERNRQTDLQISATIVGLDMTITRLDVVASQSPLIRRMPGVCAGLHWGSTDDRESRMSGLGM